MSKLQQIFQTILQTEEAVLPLFIHNPVSNAVAAVVIGAESFVFNLVSELSKAPTQTQAPAAPAAPAPAASN